MVDSRSLSNSHTGTIGGEIAVEVTNPYELVPLGDGSWLTDGPDGNPVRWSPNVTWTGCSSAATP
ncbi:hypothetical protein [Streptomyces sp. HUAS TT20]|uniref:hypothetical protein n=1 Tax=Streptomyces sp. HUAS TT20 TaxID=3447509 RepID=UPI0021DA6197|nr:hypothetical protein [Streptomyces sp. HUAS 15-9]UXY32917.1 hypothetical protein N8I87_18650 [Streptomyces sp. HUAS 15-9]